MQTTVVAKLKNACSVDTMYARKIKTCIILGANVMHTVKMMLRKERMRKKGRLRRRNALRNKES